MLEVANGAQACTLTTEHSLGSVSTGGVYQARLDFNPAVEGSTPDQFVVAVKTKCKSGSTARYEQSFNIVGAQYLDCVVTEPFAVPHYGEVLLTQTTGAAGRTIDFSIFRIDA